MTVKMNKKRTSKQQSRPMIMDIAKGVIIALIVTVAAVLALALIVKEKGIDSAAISAVNQAIKVAAIFIAAMISSRGAKEKQLITGALSGLVYIVVGYLIFSLIEGDWGDITLLLTDAAMGVMIGALVGLIFGKLLKKKQ